MAKYGHDYVLRWPAEIFAAEASAVASKFNVNEFMNASELLFAEAFSGPHPTRELHERGPGGRAWTDDEYNASKAFVIGLANGTDDFPTERRRYWIERNREQSIDGFELSLAQLTEQWLQIVNDFDANGYFDQVVPSACADGANDRERNLEMSDRLSDRAGIQIVWPIDMPEEFGVPDELFFTMVEVMHDCVARPRQRRYHEHGDDWHYFDFDIEPGQALYRWRINQLFARTNLDLRLADEGDDIGFLIHSTDASRTDLISRVLASTTASATDPVARAVSKFRSRSANRLDKKEACRDLAHELEPIRSQIKVDLLSADEGMLFQIANQFAIRHNRADQHDEYVDHYLDWLFWTYLATIELMRRLAART